MVGPVNIVKGYPPNIDAIDAVFKVRGKRGMLYTYGDTIYVPDGHDPSPEIRAHESVHYVRQTKQGITAWWDRYLVDPEYRLAEELPAHHAEYCQFCALHRDANQRVKFLYTIAGRLSGPLYGGLVDHNKARRLIAQFR